VQSLVADTILLVSDKWCGLAPRRSVYGRSIESTGVFLQPGEMHRLEQRHFSFLGTGQARASKGGRGGPTCRQG